MLNKIKGKFYMVKRTAKLAEQMMLVHIWNVIIWPDQSCVSQMEILNLASWAKNKEMHV